MPGTFNGTTLTISATPVDGALIPDKSATNVAGIAIVGSDINVVNLASTQGHISEYPLMQTTKLIGLCQKTVTVMLETRRFIKMTALK